MITYLCHAPDRATFLGVMNALLHPVDGTPLMEQDEDGNWIAHPDVIVSEIGPIIKGYTDENDNWIETKNVPGHHVNLAAIGPLERYLTGEITVDDVTYAAFAQTDENGHLRKATDRSRILALLGAMTEMDPADGIPAGEQGASGMRILDETTIATPDRIILGIGTDR